MIAARRPQPAEEFGPHHEKHENAQKQIHKRAHHRVTEARRRGLKSRTGIHPQMTQISQMGRMEFGWPAAVRGRPGLTALIDASTELAHTAILVANEPVVWVYCETPSLIKARSVVKKACDWSSACYRLAIPPGGEQEQSGTDTAIAVAKGSRTKNPRARGDAEQLQMAALLEHHGYSNGRVERTDPIPGRTLRKPPEPVARQDFLRSISNRIAGMRLHVATE